MQLFKTNFHAKQICFFEHFVSVQKPFIKSWFYVATAHMSIFVLFVSPGVLFEGVFYWEYP